MSAKRTPNLLGFTISMDMEDIQTRIKSEGGFLEKDQPLLESLGWITEVKDKPKTVMNRVKGKKTFVRRDDITKNDLLLFFDWVNKNDKFQLPWLVLDLLLSRYDTLKKSIDSVQTSEGLRTYQKKVLEELERFLRAAGVTDFTNRASVKDLAKKGVVTIPEEVKPAIDVGDLQKRIQALETSLAELQKKLAEQQELAEMLKRIESLEIEKMEKEEMLKEKAERDAEMAKLRTRIETLEALIASLKKEKPPPIDKKSSEYVIGEIRSIIDAIDEFLGKIGTLDATQVFTTYMDIIARYNAVSDIIIEHFTGSNTVSDLYENLSKRVDTMKDHIQVKSNLKVLTENLKYINAQKAIAHTVEEIDDLIAFVTAYIEHIKTVPGFQKYVDALTKLIEGLNRRKERIGKKGANAEEAARLAREAEEAERVAREAAAATEADRLAREAAAATEAERVAREAAAAEEADRLAREAAAAEEADRLAREAAAATEAERVAREAAAATEADRLAREAAAATEAERVAREAAAATEAERVAREAAAAAEADRLAREAAAAEEAERVAREAAAAAEADRLAREAAAAAEADRLAREAAAAAEADRLAREAAAAAEADRLAREAAAAEEAALQGSQQLFGSNNINLNWNAARNLNRQRKERNRVAREAAEANRVAREAAEANRVAREAAEANRVAREAAEANRVAREAAAAEANRLAGEAAAVEANRLAGEAAAVEANRLAGEAGVAAEQVRIPNRSVRQLLRGAPSSQINQSGNRQTRKKNNRTIQLLKTQGSTVKQQREQRKQNQPNVVGYINTDQENLETGKFAYTSRNQTEAPVRPYNARGVWNASLQPIGRKNAEPEYGEETLVRGPENLAASRKVRNDARIAEEEQKAAEIARIARETANAEEKARIARETANAEEKARIARETANAEQKAAAKISEAQAKRLRSLEVLKRLKDKAKVRDKYYIKPYISGHERYTQMKKKLAEVNEDLALSRFLEHSKDTEELVNALDGIKRVFERDIAAYEEAAKAKANEIYSAFGGRKTQKRRRKNSRSTRRR
jgi:hypothetical protein